MSIDVKIRNNIIINHSIIEPVWEFIGQTDWSLLAGYYNNLLTNKNLLNDLPGLLWLLTPARLSNFRDIWNVMELLVFNILTLLGVRNEHQGWKELKMRLPPLSFKINQPTVLTQWRLKLAKIWICQSDLEKVFEGITHLFSNLYTF